MREKLKRQTGGDVCYTGQVRKMFTVVQDKEGENKWFDTQDRQGKTKCLLHGVSKWVVENRKNDNERCQFGCK